MFLLSQSGCFQKCRIHHETHADRANLITGLPSLLRQSGVPPPETTGGRRDCAAVECRTYEAKKNQTMARWLRHWSRPDGLRCVPPSRLLLYRRQGQGPPDRETLASTIGVSIMIPRGVFFFIVSLRTIRAFSSFCLFLPDVPSVGHLKRGILPFSMYIMRMEAGLLPTHVFHSLSLRPAAVVASCVALRLLGSLEEIPRRS